MPAALPHEIDVREEFDGVRYALPARGENPIRAMAGNILLVVGLADTFVVGAILGAVLLGGGQRAPLAVVVGASGAVVFGGCAVALMGLWFKRSRTDVIVGPELVRSVTRLGPIRFSRTRRRDRIDRLVLETERITYVNIPGAREGNPEFVTLRATSADAPGGVILATGYHRRLLGPFALALAARLGVEPPTIPEAAPPARR